MLTTSLVTQQLLSHVGPALDLVKIGIGPHISRFISFRIEGCCIPNGAEPARARPLAGQYWFTGVTPKPGRFYVL